MTAMRTLGTAALFLGGLAGSAAAQAAPPAQTVDTTNSTRLSAEKQRRIQAFIVQQAKLKDNEPLKTEDGNFTPGMTVPDSIALSGLPEDRATEVPQVTSYQFFLAGNGIVVVDPATRVVVQVIRKE
jgi:hypothetical protein